MFKQNYDRLPRPQRHQSQKNGNTECPPHDLIADRLLHSADGTQKKLVKDNPTIFPTPSNSRRAISFAETLIRKFEKVVTIDPRVEIDSLSLGLRMVLRQTARKDWSRMDIYNELKDAQAVDVTSLSDVLKKAIQATVDNNEETDIAKVTIKLIKNILIQTERKREQRQQTKFNPNR